MHYFSLVEEFLEVSDDELPGDGEEDVPRHGELPRQLPRHLLRLLNRLPPPEVLKRRGRETLLLVKEDQRCPVVFSAQCLLSAFKRIVKTHIRGNIYAAVTYIHFRSIST